MIMKPDEKVFYGHIVNKEVNEEGIFQPTFRITELALDRHGEVVLPKGMDMEGWKVNPVVFFGHNSWSLPIGRGVVETINRTNEYIEVDKIFDDDGEDELATIISSKLQKGFLQSSSIGFISKEQSDEPVVDGQKGVTHSKSELLESSIVPIPALPSAGRVKDVAKEFQNFRHELKNVGFTEIDDAIGEYINETSIINHEQATAIGFGRKFYAPMVKSNTTMLKEHRKVLQGMIGDIDKIIEANEVTKIPDPLSDNFVSESMEIVNTLSLAKLKFKNKSRGI